jgi:hypothetical protein
VQSNELDVTAAHLVVIAFGRVPLQVGGQPVKAERWSFTNSTCRNA